MTVSSMPATRPIGFWLKLVDRLIDEKFAETLAEFDVTRHQWEALNILSPGPSTLAKLTAELALFIPLTGVDNTTLELNQLVERGWVDVAFEYYELTGEGAKQHADVHRHVAKARSTAIAELSETDYDTMVRSLERMAQALGWQS